MASTIKVDNVQNQPGTNIINKCGTTITLGASSDTIALAAGATQTGFGRTGTVDWITTPKVTGDSPITAVSGNGYFLNTTAGSITVNLPAGAAGSIVSMADYAATWQTNNVTVNANGSEKMGGITQAATLTTEGQSVTFVYVDSTQGWINTMDSTSNVRGNPYIIATGGCISCSGNDKIHTFTGPGTFCVSTAAVSAANNAVSYMVVASGGGGGYGSTGGGGAGGFREYKSPVTPYTSSPLDGNPGGTSVTVAAGAYPICVGAGAAGSTGATLSGTNGPNAIFSTITSTGGGGGGSDGSPCAGAGSTGGSGGGAANGGTGGVGNTPPVSPLQGNPGGNAPWTPAGGGGGGAIGNGGTNSPPNGGVGGAGTPTFISGSDIAYAGGGGGGARPGPNSSGGVGGGGNGGNCVQSGTNGADNTGGGGGSGQGSAPGAAGNGSVGGSGIVIIRYKIK